MPAKIFEYNRIGFEDKNNMMVSFTKKGDWIHFSFEESDPISINKKELIEFLREIYEKQS
jgi:hypothetical protein